MYPPLGILQTWEGIPPPGQPSDHVGAEEGHRTFLGGDAWDMGLVYNPVYAIADMSPVQSYPYTATDRQGQTQYRGWNFKARLSDGRLVFYAHLQNEVAWRDYREGQQIEIIGDYLNYDHLHFEMEGVVAGDMPALFAIPAPIKPKRRIEPMIEQGKETKDGWFKAGWFTHAYPNLDHSVLMIVSGFDPPERVDIYIEEEDGSKRGFTALGDFKRHQTKKLTNTEIQGTGMIWVRPIGGELLDVTVRTIFK